MAKKSERKIVSPRQQRAINSKASILDAAEKVFAEDGLHGGRIDRIAKVSGVNKQRIYAYYGSKEQWYRQVLLDVYSQAAQNERLISLGKKDIGRLTEIVLDAFFEFHEKHPFFWRLLAWENLNGGQSLSIDDWQSIRTVYIEHIRKLYNAGQRKGVFSKSIDFATYMMTLFAASYFYFSNQLTMAHLLDLKLDSQKMRKKTTRQIERIIRDGVLQRH